MLKETYSCNSNSWTKLFQVIFELSWQKNVSCGFNYGIFRDNDDRLATINAVFKTIDLTTLTLAPLSAGLVFDLISNSAAAYFIAGWNMISVIFEYLLLESIYNEFPQLAHKKIFEKDHDERKESIMTKVSKIFCIGK